MLRVGIVSASYYPILGGVSEQVHGLAVGLARRGHDVTILTGHCRMDSEERTPRGVEVERLGRTFLLPINGGRTALALSPRLEAELSDRIEGRFDLLHIHAPYEPGLPLAALSIARVPLVGTFHASGRTGWPFGFLARCARGRLDRLTLRLAVSRAAERWARELFGGEYHTLPNAIDTGRFRAERGPASDRRTRLELLVVGRLEPRKGLEAVIEALRLLPPGLPEWRLRVVGDGPLRARLERAARSHRGRIELLGRVAPASLPRLYAESDLALAPATFGESFGVVLLEAMASGLPVLASDLPGYREVLAASGAGACVPPGDPAAWSTAIADLLLAPRSRSEMGARGRERAHTFDWSVILPRIEATYEEALGRGDAHLDPLDQSVTSARAVTMMSSSKSVSASSSTW